MSDKKKQPPPQPQPAMVRKEMDDGRELLFVGLMYEDDDGPAFEPVFGMTHEQAAQFATEMMSAAVEIGKAAAPAILLAPNIKIN